VICNGTGPEGCGDSVHPGLIVCFACAEELESRGQPHDTLRDTNYEPPDDDGECFRGGESAAYEASEMARIQRELK
jgi:hypothetical protein